MFTTTSIIGAALGIIYLLLKYYPVWRKKRNAKRDKEILDDFGKALIDGNDIRVSELLDDEYRRVRGQKGADTTGQ